MVAKAISSVVAGLGGAAPPAVDDPLDIFGAALLGWWRAGDWTLTGSLIDQLTDLSGNGRHMVQTGSARPTITTVGGHDAARFDPSSAAQYLATAGTPDIGAAPWAIWSVYRNDAAVWAGMVVVVQASTIELRQAASRRVQFRVGGTSVDGSTSISSLASVLCEDADGTATIYVNNSSDGSASATRDGAADTWCLGARSDGSFANDMTLLEAAVISGVITSGQRADLQAYAAQYPI